MKDDLNDAITRRRQHEMKLGLARTGLGHHIRRALPTPLLSPATCQWRARDFRRETQERAKALLQAEEGAQLLFATWVPPAGLCADRPFRDGPQALLQEFEAGCQAAGIFAVAAAAEADFDVGESSWQATVHAVLAASVSRPPETVSGDLRASLRQPVTPRHRAIHQPLRIKAVTDLDGALSYAFKSLAILSAVQRSPWFDDVGKPRVTKQKLRTPQLKQLVRQTIRHGLEGRVLLTKIEEIQS
jgi:hypothetical protein